MSAAAIRFAMTRVVSMHIQVYNMVLGALAMVLFIYLI